MPTAAFLMQLLLLLHERGMPLALFHLKRDYNQCDQWVDELTHPNPQRFNSERQIEVDASFPHFFLSVEKMRETSEPAAKKRRKT